LFTETATPGALGLIKPPWTGAIRVISIIVNTWHKDRRRERFDNPNIIDVGWTDVMMPEYLESRRVTETVHIKMKGLMKNEEQDAVPLFNYIYMYYLTNFLSVLSMELPSKRAQWMFFTRKYKGSSHMTPPMFHL
jgi:hypothetical protein